VLGGWKGWIADDSFVHHYGHRTFIGAGIDWERSMYRNAGLFVEKWGLTRAPDTGAPIYPDDFLVTRRFDALRDVCPLPESVPYRDVTEALAAYYKGVALLGAGDASAAVPVLQAAVLGSPQTADFHNALGAALFEAARFDEAILVLTRAADLAPQDEAIRANLHDALELRRPRPVRDRKRSTAPRKRTAASRR
jgi:tetratricopeptide (TPR) repeat protein